MHLKYRNINDAFRGLVGGIHSGKIPTYVCASRYGEVAQVEEPVILTYSRPLERVLFNAARDVNPFSLLYESLWMLDGRNDVAPLTYYTKRFAEFSDDRETFNGAYGARWRRAEHFEWSDTGDAYRSEVVDQLQVLIDHLRAKPESRRAVLQMWNVEDDLLKIDSSRDVCCNLSVCFSVEQGRGDNPEFLNMTVFNRSNDLIWGVLGANYVTFSVLQEYVAAHLGLKVGVYNQVTNNLHVYTERFEAEKWLACATSGDARHYESLPLVANPKRFDAEMPEFVERHSRDAMAKEYREPFLRGVAQPMCIAFHHYKRGDLESALDVAAKIEADDWRIVCCAWLERRQERRKANRPTPPPSETVHGYDPDLAV